MASRYPESCFVDYCFHPIRVIRDGVDVVVPCQKCDGCLLHKANQWSMRCGMEIESTPATIFGSLTYNNRYYPKLYPVVGSQFLSSQMSRFRVSRTFDDCVWVSDHPDNIRYNGVKEVSREDNLIIKPKNGFYNPIDISHWDNFNYPAIGYASKRDIQLWLKLLRRFLDEQISYKSKRVLERGYFRYFIISEVGPTTFRSHYHFLIFCQSSEIAQALLSGALYQNWQMCDKDRFEPYVHLCDSGARGYVTQYLTSFSSLPVVYTENKEIRPFRLSSKAPSIGYVEQDKEKIYEDVARGIIKYSRAVPRLESTSLLCYPKDYCITLFPKCYEYSKLSVGRRADIYGFLYRAVREDGYSYYLLSARLSQSLHASDYLAMRACYRFCKEIIDSPEHYFYLLDMYYYLVDMENLRNFYLAQESIDYRQNPERIFEFYPNIEYICNKGCKFDLRALDLCLRPLGFDISVLIGNKEFFEFVRVRISELSSNYRKEVHDIVSDMIKMSKFNEETNNSPSIV